MVVSTAYAGRVAGRRRAELLAELVALRRSIVVSGAHGKTTTAAMIAYCLDALGDDPSFLIGGEVPQLGGNARAGAGWLVVEGDESDGTVFELPADIAVVTNVELDHHATFASTAELEQSFERWAAGLPEGRVVWGRDVEPVDLELAVPGEHNRLNAACALAALELAGFDRDAAAEALVGFRGVGRRLEDHGEAGGVRLVDDYAHHPAELAATIAAARELVVRGPPRRPLPAAPLLAHAAPRAGARPGARGGRRRRRHRDLRRARGAGRGGHRQAGRRPACSRSVRGCRSAGRRRSTTLPASPRPWRARAGSC